MTSIVALAGSILSSFTGVKTYLAAAGLIGLSISQFATGQYDAAVSSLMTGLGLIGLHSKIDSTTTPATTVTTTTTAVPGPPPPTLTV